MNGLSVLNVKHIALQGLITVGRVEDVLEKWITTVHGSTIV